MTHTQTPTPATGSASEVMTGRVDTGDRTEEEDILAYLRACYGDLAGRAHVALGRGPRLNDGGKYGHATWIEKNVAWPADAETLAGALAASSTQGDAYVCPYLMWADKRTPGAVVGRVLVHADDDGGTATPEMVRALGGFAVASGTAGHVHVLIPLSVAVPAHQHAVLERALVALLDADAKISANDLLRPPGTLNHKPTTAGAAATRVRWVVRPSGTRVDPQELAAKLGVALPAALNGAVQGANQGSDNGAVRPAIVAAAAPVELQRYPAVLTAIAADTGDRSADTYRIVRACLDTGLTLPQARTAVTARTDLAQRMAERRDDDVLACWLKAVDEQQGRRWLTGSPPTVAPAAAASSDPPDTPRVWSATDLRAGEQARWLAKGRLPHAAISLLVGDEGIGKSLLWVWIVAAVTTGTALPEFGIPAREPRRVAIVVTEDDWSSTVRPRLDVAGADLSMIAVVCENRDGSGSPVFPRDMPLLYEMTPAPTLVVVDAWLDTVPGRLSVKDPQQARAALHPWHELATVTDAAVLLLTHTNRVASASPRDKYGATGELRKKARMTLFAQTDEDGRLVVGPEKMNTAAPTAASAFAITPVQHFPPTVDDDGTVPRLVYVGESARTAREHIADAFDAGSDGDRQERTEAEAWLQVYIEMNGPSVLSADAKRDAAKAGIKERTLQRARTKLRVQIGYLGQPPKSTWSLPETVSRGTAGTAGINTGHNAMPPCANDTLMAQRAVPPKPCDSEDGTGGIPPTTSEDTAAVPAVPAVPTHTETP